MQSGAHKKEAAGLEGSRGLVRSLVVRRDDQNRARCEPDHPLTGRAEHKVCERAMPAGSRDDEICVAFSCHFRDGLGGLADRRLHVDFRVKSGGLQIGHLQTYPALETILIEMNWLRAPTHDHQFIDVRDDNL